MIRLSIVLGGGLLGVLVWTWLASLLLSPIYAAGLGVVAGFMTLLLLATLTSTQRVNDQAGFPAGRPVTPPKRRHGTILQEPR